MTPSLESECSLCQTRGITSMFFKVDNRLTSFDFTDVISLKSAQYYNRSLHYNLNHLFLLAVFFAVP